MIEQADRDDIDLLVVRRLEFLREVRNGTFDPDPDFARVTRAFLTTEFDAGRLHSWLAHVDGRCVGIVSVLLWARPPRPDAAGTHDGYIINMHVESGQQRRGIGRRLLDVCLASRERLGIGEFFLHTTADGRALYESVGFRGSPAWLEWSAD